MGIKDRKERERDAVRASILDAARELFATHGYEGVSMRAIAEKIEYSPTVIYQHFRDKQTLIGEMCYADFRELAAGLSETSQIADPIERLYKCGEAYVRFALAHPNHYRLMFMTPYPVHAVDEDSMNAKGNPELDAYALLRQQVQMAAEAERLRKPQDGQPVDVDLVAQTLWAGLHGLISLEIVLACNEWTPWRPLEDRARAMLEALGGGLFIRPPAQD